MILLNTRRRSSSHTGGQAYLAKLCPSQSAKQPQIGEQTEDKQYRADDHEQPDVYFLISDAEDVCPSVKPLNRNIESPVDPGDAAVCHACSSQ